VGAKNVDLREFAVILTDREIRIAIDRELIGLDPNPDAESFSSTSVDLTLHDVGSQFKAP
jgi:deoxycytidine triphosphate deaminase